MSFCRCKVRRQKGVMSKANSQIKMNRNAQKQIDRLTRDYEQKLTNDVNAAVADAVGAYQVGVSRADFATSVDEAARAAGWTMPDDRLLAIVDQTMSEAVGSEQA